MKIAIGADHGGYKLKEEIKKYLDEKQIEYVDLGANTEERTDYPIFAEKVSKAIAISPHIKNSPFISYCLFLFH